MSAAVVMHQRRKRQRRQQQPSSRVCQGCGRELGVIEALRWGVCLDCTRARERTVTRYRGRCHCGRKAKPGAEVGHSGRGRRWIPCKRCLGVIRETQ